MDDNEVVEIIKDFLIESSENLTRLEQELVELEKRPKDIALLGSIFRTFHTIKGTCGFLHFTTLEAVTHGAESLLNQLRNFDRELTPALVTLILETVDAIKTQLNHIEATNHEGTDPYNGLRSRLATACELKKTPVSPAESPAPAAILESTTTNPAQELAAAAPPAAPVAAKAVVVDAPAPVAASAAPVPVAAEPPPSVAPAADSEGGPGPKATLSVADSTIRVDVGLLDNLMNLVGELVLVRNQILQAHAKRDEASLTATAQRLNLITTQVQERVMKTRMQPIGMVWNKLPRVVRDLATECGKQIAVEMDGAETELDKSIIESIKDPLTHIVRNCADHGIELPAARAARGKSPQGRLLLRAFHEGGQVNIEISDDGNGIDLQKLKGKALQRSLITAEQAERMSEREATHLIFLPGLSTAEKVTNISGRGVGMDVVRINIERIGGTVDVVSRAGEGTTVKIRIPLTLAIIPGLIIGAGGERFVIPQVSLLELVRLEGEAGRRQIELINGTPVYRRRGQLLPIAYLARVLKQKTESKASDVINIVVLQAEDRQFGLVVDMIHDTQEIVVKPLAKQLKNLKGYAGATIMGDGRVALILDVLGLGQLSGVLTELHDQARTEAEHHEAATIDQRQTFLVVKAGRFERLAVPLSVVARLEEFPLSRVEQASGKFVTQYRGQILPLVYVTQVIDPGSAVTVEQRDPMQVVVFADGTHMVGAIVDQVIDIVDDVVTVRQPTAQHGLVGSAVVAQKVTDFLDVDAVIATAQQDWFAQVSASGSHRTVMLAEHSAFLRGILRTHLEMAGHHVVEAASEAEAMDRLERTSVDLVVADLDLAEDGATGLLRQMRNSSRLAGIPALGLGTRGTNGNAPPPGLSFDEYQSKNDHAAMLAAIERMVEADRALATVPELVG